jgi:Adenylate kinase
MWSQISDRVDRGVTFVLPSYVQLDRAQTRRRCGRRTPGYYACATGGKQSVFFVLGNAGAGKGTQCELLSARFGLDHVSAGDLLRKEVSSGSEQGAMIADIMREGSIVPSKVTLSLLRTAIESS